MITVRNKNGDYYCEPDDGEDPLVFSSIQEAKEYMKQWFNDEQINSMIIEYEDTTTICKDF